MSTRRDTAIYVATSVVTALLSLLLLAAFYLTITTYSPANVHSGLIVIAMILVAILGGALRSKITLLLESTIFRASKRDEEVLKALNSNLLAVSSLQDVIRVYLRSITSRLDVSDVFCVTMQHNEAGELSVKSLISLAEEDERQLPPLEGHPRMLDFLKLRAAAVATTQLAEELASEEAWIATNSLATHLGGLSEREFVSNHAAKAEIDSVMKSLNCEICVPFVVRGSLFAVAFISLSKRSRRRSIADSLSFLDSATADILTSMQRANYFEGDLQKTEFISIASHELRTPLTAIRGYLSMILQERITGDEISETSRSHLADSYKLCDQLISMVNDILMLSRLESGKTVLEPEQLNLSEIVHEVVKSLKEQSSKKKVRVTVKKHRQSPFGWADEDGLKTVLENIITNSITYNKEGGSVVISLHAHPNRQSVEIKIADNGIGMTKTQMEHLFEKFYRVSSHQTDGISGTGLGLTITNEFLTRMHGSISLQSKPKKGTTFSIEIPLFSSERLAEARDSVQANSPIPEHPVGLILLSTKRSHDDFNASDYNLLEIVGHQAITAIQRAKLYEGDQAKTQFVSMASHELLTPISAIEGYLRAVLTQEKALKEKTIYFLTNVENSATRLSSLVKDLLSVSRLESGKMTVTIAPTDIQAICKKVLTELQFIAKDKKITLTLDPVPSNLPLAAVDSERMHQVLVNLMSNSIKYNRENGRVTVRIEATKRSDILRIIITDTGIGMTKEQMAHLFEKFYRVASQQTVGIIGTGLGLYITRSILERMGGRIQVESKLEIGSTFTVSLPVAENVV